MSCTRHMIEILWLRVSPTLVWWAGIAFVGSKVNPFRKRLNGLKWNKAVTPPAKGIDPKNRLMLPENGNPALRINNLNIKQQYEVIWNFVPWLLPEVHIWQG